jgi:hypothetical protein
MSNEEAGVTTNSGARAFTSILRITNPATPDA